MTNSIINVKNYGARGDGTTDDTAAIQRAIDAAFGPASNPHGGDSNNANGYPANQPLFFPNGTYNISAPLVLTQVQGGRIYGAGKFATRIVNVNSSGGALYSGTVFLTQAFSYCLVENMSLVAAPPVSANFTGSISGTTLTASSGTGIQPGQILTGASTAAANSTITRAAAPGTLGWTATVTTSAPHGVPSGQIFQVVILGTTPGGYSGNAPVIATSTGASSFTYLLPSDPGAETVPGTYSIKIIDGSMSLPLLSLVWSGGTVTATTPAPHGIPNGNIFKAIIYGTNPGKYRGTVIATVTGASTFTYPLANNPGLQVLAFYNVNGGGNLNATTLTWAAGTVSVVTTTPHGVSPGNTFTTVVAGSASSFFPDGGADGFNGTFTATSTGTNTFTYPLATNPGVAIQGSYTISPTVIVSGATTTWTVSNNQNVGSGSMVVGTVNRAFNMAWDGTEGVAVTGTALNADTFRNISFEGGDHGIGIGDGGFMGSEILFTGCDFIGCAVGMMGFNQNALDFTIVGGSFQNCGTGIDTNLTSTFSYVSGVSFSGSTKQDISFRSYDGMDVNGCNSTSLTFLSLLGSVNIHTTACAYIPASGGAYATPCQAFVVLDGCLATNSVLQRSTGAQTANAVYLRGCNVPGTFISGSTGIPTPAENH